MKPGWHVIHTTRYFDVEYKTNASGYRDVPRNLDKGSGTRRILQYGDSHVFGWGVQRRDRFTNRLEAMRPELEFWNLAVPGYGLDQQMLAYESLLLTVFHSEKNQSNKIELVHRKWRQCDRCREFPERGMILLDILLQSAGQ